MVFKTYEDGSEFTGKHAAFVLVAGSAVGAVSYGLGRVVGKTLEKAQIRRSAKDETKQVQEKTD